MLYFGLWKYIHAWSLSGIKTEFLAYILIKNVPSSMENVVAETEPKGEILLLVELLFFSSKQKIGLANQNQLW